MAGKVCFKKSYSKELSYQSSFLKKLNSTRASSFNFNTSPWLPEDVSAISNFFMSFCCRWRSALLWRTFFTTAVVAVVLRGFIQFCRSGKCGLFGQGGLIMFDVSSAAPIYNTKDLLAVLFIGILGGVLGSLYNYFVDKVLRTYSIINEYVS